MVDPLIEGFYNEILSIITCMIAHANTLPQVGA